MADSQTADLTCGACPQWQETKVQCPGWGFCGNGAANRTMTDFNVPLSCHFLPANTACKLHKR